MNSGDREEGLQHLRQAASSCQVRIQREKEKDAESSSVSKFEQVRVCVCVRVYVCVCALVRARVSEKEHKCIEVSHVEWNSTTTRNRTSLVRSLK